jgi:hypothetical protein
MDKDDLPPKPDAESPQTEEPPPYSPDPDLITYLERQARPGEVKVWKPQETRSR